jgi:hypothetical protein
MNVNGNSHVKVVVQLEGSEQFIYANGELVTELHWEQFINKDGTLNTYRMAWGNRRTPNGRFVNRVNLLGSWTDSNLPAEHREAILKAFNREQGNIARISSL